MKPIHKHGRGAVSRNVTRSCGNVFMDLGFPPAEAEALLLRSELAIQLHQVIRQRKLTQARAAKLLGVTQPRVSDLMTGKIDRFNIESLIAMLARAGMTVTVAVRPAAA